MGIGKGRELEVVTCVRMAGAEGGQQGSEGHWEAMRALSSRPFCSCDSRRVSLWDLSVGLRYATRHRRRDLLQRETPRTRASLSGGDPEIIWGNRWPARCSHSGWLRDEVKLGSGAVARHRRWCAILEGDVYHAEAVWISPHFQQSWRTLCNKP
jgi:hypothetical protein